MTIRDRIKVLANNKGMSLPNVESVLGFGNGTILKWDKNTPNADKLSKVADYFDVSVDYLLGRDTASMFPENITAVARDIMDLPEDNQKLAIDMIRMMSERGKEAKDK